MSFILTLVASIKNSPLNNEHIDNITGLAKGCNVLQTCQPVWLAENEAVEIGIDCDPPEVLDEALRNYCDSSGIDFFIMPLEKRRKKLLLADMDSTIVKDETLDELAEHAGLKAKVADITAAAMNGDLDFHSALRERVKLLENLPVSKLLETLAQTSLSRGAETFVRTMKEHGARCVLISGGFTFFTENIAKKCGFQHHHGNILEIDSRNEVLTGRVEEPILDKFSKQQYLKEYIEDIGVKALDVLAIGDGANDIPMLKDAGLGIGYHPKPAVKAEIRNVIVHGDLTAALYAQGYAKSQFYKP